MELYINPPAYFTNMYGIDDEVYEADSFNKILLIKDMLLRATKKVKTKAKFDYERFREDLDYCVVS